MVGVHSVDWLHCRNSLNSHLSCSAADRDDRLQEACGFLLLELGRDDIGPDDVGLAIIRAASRANRGQTLCYEPADREDWENRTEGIAVRWYLLHGQRGAGQASQRGWIDGGRMIVNSYPDPRRRRREKPIAYQSLADCIANTETVAPTAPGRRYSTHYREG